MKVGAHETHAELSAFRIPYLCEESWLDLKRLGPRSLSDNGNGILHPNRVASVL